jgi:serine/threonine protein kinase
MTMTTPSHHHTLTPPHPHSTTPSLHHPLTLPLLRYEVLYPKRTSLSRRVPCGDEGFLSFLSYLLTPDPLQRPTAEEALQHPWLTQLYPPEDVVPD